LAAGERAGTGCVGTGDRIMWTVWHHHLLRWTEAPSLAMALRRLGEYTALRLWVLIIGSFSVEANLRTARLMGRLWWWLMPRHRDRALANLRPALGDQYNERQLRHIAQQSLEHFAQLYLVELAMMPRLITPWSWARHVELGTLGPALELLLARRGMIMLTGHFGNYELLGYAICRLGLPLTAVMRPLDNPLINRYLEQSRAAGGLTLLYKKGASAAAGDIIDNGGALCFIADQDAGRKGLFVDFFGRKASTYKSIGLLAMAKRVPVVVGHAVRVRTGCHYRIDVERIIQPEEWDSQNDPLYWITQTFSHALEAAIRRHPEQYLWMHRRWKHRPKGEPAAG
jgi:KDO2-lipid IV(A) lauroyltransferase